MSEHSYPVVEKESDFIHNTVLPKTVSTEPTKKFFVQMLTRDITLEDSILDLLDNCIDGILRVKQGSAENGQNADEGKPYVGFKADISFDKAHFEMKDNCGGIPASLIERAFRLGRPDVEAGEEAVEEPEDTVGVYGIGMKRAIFKMGGNALVLTQSGQSRYQVLISDDWLRSKEWQLSVEVAPNAFPEDGTTISVGSLNPGISERFSSEDFQDELLRQISSHYAVIIAKGFEITVNKQLAASKPVLFKSQAEGGDNAILPYIFTTELDGVKVFLAIGLRSAIPSMDEMDDEMDEIQMSTKEAGWTVICNDRVVVSNDKSELTGWGTGGIPRYHVQYRSISGVVEFHGNAAKLPTTTTKRGLETSSAIYQRVLDRMREGTRIFINYTNDWKAREKESKAQVSFVRTLGFPALKAEVEKKDEHVFRLTEVGKVSGLGGVRFQPKLPKPLNESTVARIIYTRERKDIEALARLILGDFSEISEKDLPRKVGETTFDLIAEQNLDKTRNP